MKLRIDIKKILKGLKTRLCQIFCFSARRAFWVFVIFFIIEALFSFAVFYYYSFSREGLGEESVSFAQEKEDFEPITRLIDMGVKPFLVASSIQAIMAQRLVRVICKKCKVVDEDPDPSFLRLLNITPDDIRKHPIYKGSGCSQCQGTGFKGRIAAFEMVELNNEIRELAFAKAPTTELRKACVASGMRTLMEDGKIKIFKGITTPSEVVRISQTEGVEV